MNRHILRNGNKGQSTVEYLVIFAAIISAILVFMVPGGFFQRAFSGTLSGSTQSMTDTVALMGQAQTGF